MATRADGEELTNISTEDENAQAALRSAEDEANMSTETEQALWPRKAGRDTAMLPVRRSRAREPLPRVRRPPKWSERLMPRRVA
jgi:hypothetical protein